MEVVLSRSASVSEFPQAPPEAEAGEEFFGSAEQRVGGFSFGFAEQGAAAFQDAPWTVLAPILVHKKANANVSGRRRSRVGDDCAALASWMSGK